MPVGSRKRKRLYRKIITSLQLNQTDLFISFIGDLTDLSRIVDHEGNGLLHLSAFYGNRAAIAYLLTRDLDPNGRNEKGDSPLHCAIMALDRNAGYEIAQLLLHANADVFAYNNEGKSILERAAELSCSSEMIVLLYSAVVKIEKDMMAVAKMLVDADWPLMYSFWIKNLELTKNMIQLYDQITCVEEGEEEYSTPLHDALDADAPLDIITFLLGYGINPNARNHMDLETPLHFVAEFNRAQSHYEVMRTLLAAGADPNVPNIDERTPFHLALRNGNENVVALMLQYGAHALLKDRKNKTSLHFAASNGNIAVIRTLLDLGVGIDERSNRQLTALHIAARNCRSNCVEYLLSQGAEVDAVEDNGHTPLLLAAQGCVCSDHLFEGIGALESLLKYGADVEKRSKDNRTILDMIIEKRNTSNAVVVVRHLACMERSKISDYTMKLIEDIPELKNFYEICTNELELMKKRRLYGYVSFYRIFDCAESTLAGFARNENLVKALNEYEKSNRLSLDFPIFGSRIADRLFEEAKKQRIVKKAEKFVSRSIGFNDSRHLVVKNVVKYLKQEELTRLANACDVCRLASGSTP